MFNENIIRFSLCWFIARNMITKNKNKPFVPIHSKIHNSKILIIQNIKYLLNENVMSATVRIC